MVYKKRTYRMGMMVALLAVLPFLANAAGVSETAPVRSHTSLVVSETQDTLTCVNSEGNTVTLTKRPTRTVVNYTSLVGLWYRSGGVAVGMPETANLKDLPEAARAIETTGHTANPNIEKILSLEPDLVIIGSNMEKQRAMAELLAGAGAEILGLDYENYGDFVGILDLFYRLNGRDPSADSSAEALKASIETLAAKTKALPPVRFLSLFASASGVQAETDRTHTAFIAQYLGGQNITSFSAPSKSQTRLPFSIERIHMEDPEVVFITTMGDGGKIKERMRQDFMESDAWKGLRAVRSGRVHFLPNDLFLHKPNDRFPEAFEQMATLLYPAGS